VLLTLRNTVKQELECFPAELCFGQCMKLSGQFAVKDPTPSMLQHDFVKQLKEHFCNITASPTRPYRDIPFHIDKNLQSCTHVWIRNDGVHKPF